MRFCIYRIQGVRPVRRAFWFFFDVESCAKQVRVIWRLGRVLSCFQCPGLFCAKDLPQVFDTSILLAVGACLDEVWNGDGGEQSNDCHHDHDFDERKAAAATEFNLHTLAFSLIRGVNSTAAVNIISRSLKLPAVKPRLLLSTGGATGRVGED